MQSHHQETYKPTFQVTTPYPLWATVSSFLPIEDYGSHKHKIVQQHYHHQQHQLPQHQLHPQPRII